MTATLRPPRISIVTSSYNQALFIGRTIESVLAQHYPDVEHIVVDGMSTDGTAEVLRRFPHLKVIREPDRGQADAINKGFTVATGHILSFLNSDDTLEPGALHRVAAALNPLAGSHVVMGRCRFIDEEDRFLGIEHPSGFEGHRRVLEVWKGHLLPQPAIFWTREVWDACGPLSIDERLMLDYDLFCRLSRRYAFCRIDQVLANYRLHTESKTVSLTDEQRLEQAITVSRRYWGPPFRWQYWRLLVSYAAFRLNRRVRAVRLMRSGQELSLRGHRLRGIGCLIIGVVLAPDVVSDVLVVPALKRMLARNMRRLPVRARPADPQTEAWRGFTGLHTDGWAGPTFVVEIEVEPRHAAFAVSATTVPIRLRGPLELEAFLDRRSLGCRAVGGQAGFAVTWDLSGAAPGRHELRIVATTFMVSHDLFGNQDYRPLSYRIVRAQLEGDGVVTPIVAAP